MDDDEEQDTYTAQLQEVFNSCDEEGKGYLTSSQLRELCGRLHLEEHTEPLLEALIGEHQDAKVIKSCFLKLTYSGQVAHICSTNQGHH